MDFELTSDQIMLRDTVRRFVAEQVVPHARAWDREERFPRDAVARLGDLGLLGVLIDPAYGGAGLGVLELCLVVEELAFGDGSLALVAASHNGLGAAHIAAAGSEAQRRRWLPDIASGASLAAWALSEPNSGSDAAAMLSFAERQGDTWRLNGAKVFITQGTVAGVYVVLAATDRSLGSRGISAFVLPAGTPGLSHTPILDKHGMRASDTAALSFVDVALPADALLGGLNEGFRATLRLLDHGRIVIGALAVGLGRAALSAARKYALERRQFGRPIADFQAIQWKLADMATELEAARLLVLRGAWLAGRGAACTKEASIAKLFASEAALRACNEAVQIHGGYGYTAEFPVERMLRDAKLLTIGEGTSEVQRLVVARQVLRADAA